MRSIEPAVTLIFAEQALGGSLRAVAAWLPLVLIALLVGRARHGAPCRRRFVVGTSVLRAITVAAMPSAGGRPDVVLLRAPSVNLRSAADPDITPVPTVFAHRPMGTQD